METVTREGLVSRPVGWVLPPSLVVRVVASERGSGAGELDWLFQPLLGEVSLHVLSSECFCEAGVQG
jgi:hypothetical protein